ncbi:MAG: hypothetical protein IPG56_03805 [Caulobacteraceae bacterium]|nr:hypothetical protein [Caulobacteraceae bacterium]
MMMTTTTPTTPPAEYTFNTFAQHIESFFSGLLTLNPEQALLRAGLSLLVFFGAVIIIWGLHVILKAITERIAPKDDATAPKQHLNIGRWTMRVARLAIFVGALIVVLRLRGFDFSDLRDSPIYGFFSVMGRIAIMLVLALAAIVLGQLGSGVSSIALRTTHAAHVALLRSAHSDLFSPASPPRLSSSSRR